MQAPIGLPGEVSPHMPSRPRPMHQPSTVSFMDRRKFSLASHIESMPEEGLWLSKSLSRRICKRFCPTETSPSPGSGPASSDICHCGREYVKHDRVVIGATETPKGKNTASQEAWSYTKDTMTLPTDAFGEIQFEGQFEQVAKYARVDYQTSMRTMQILLRNVWQLKRPNLLISITGGAKKLTLNARLNQAFKEGIVRAAASTGAWMITAGTNSGVVKLVGEAVRDYELARGTKSNVVLLGVTPWGLVHNRQELVDEHGCWPATYPMHASSNSREFNLDCNHSHFILVDDGTVKQYTSVEATFRASLEAAISKIGTLVGYANIKVPLILVLLEGGKGALETVENALKVGTPVVVIAGSGRAADILAFAYENSPDAPEDNASGKDVFLDSMDLSAEVTEELSLHIATAFGTDKDTTWNCVQTIKRCLAYKNRMNVYRDDSKHHDFDGAMLQALLKEKKYLGMDQLRLALAWNRVDIAREHIFTEDRIWKEEDLEEALHLALLDNKVEFVKLILEPSVVDVSIDLKKFLTIERLVQLYNGIPQYTMLEVLLRQITQKSMLYTLEDIGKVLKFLVGEFYKPLYLTTDKYKEVRVQKCAKHGVQTVAPTADTKPSMTHAAPVVHANGNSEKAVHVQPLKSMKSAFGRIRKPAGSIRSRQIRAREEKLQLEGYRYDFDNPWRELFLWAVLLQHRRLSEFFWTEGRLGMAGAVIAERILSSMMKRTENMEKQAELQGLITNFEEKGVGVLSHCHKKNETKAAILLIRTIPMFGNTTIMRLVAEAEVNFTFITHAASQSLVRNIWMGRLAEDTPVWQIILASVFTPFALFLRYDVYGWRKTLQGKNHLVQETAVGAPEEGMQDTSANTAVRSTEKLIVGESQLKTEKSIVGDVRKTQKSIIGDIRKTMKVGGDAGSSRRGSRFDAFGNPVPIEVVKGKRDSSNSSGSYRRSNVPVYKRLWFFVTSPVVIFIYNFISYVFFLMLYGVTMMTNFHPDTISVQEYFIYVYVFSLICEEIRQIMNDTGQLVDSITDKFRKHFREVWNILDAISQTMFVLGAILRCIPSGECRNCFEAARITLALALMLFCCRILHSFTIHRRLGPKLVMIGKMLVDMVFFILILLVFVIAYGLAMQSILYPNSVLEFALIEDVFKKAYWQIYGELFLSELEGGETCTHDPLLYRNNTMPRCAENTWFVPILLGVYILFANVLMLNLLIAMFSYTFEQVQGRTDLHWYFQRYFLVKDYSRKPFLAGPLVLLCHIYMSFKYLFSVLCCQCGEEDGWANIGDFVVRLGDVEDSELTMWERMCINGYLRKAQRDARQLQEKASTERTTLDKVDAIEKSVQKQITILEGQVNRTTEALSWIIEAMQSNGMKGKAPPPVLDRPRATRPQTARPQLKRVPSQTTQYHTQARCYSYPAKDTTILRIVVTDDQVPWQITWPDYQPTYFTDEGVIQSSHMIEVADDENPMVSLLDCYNKIDHKLKVDRRSHTGQYEVKEGMPLNPDGRTGLRGRGLLYRWGPNHAVDPVVTRWCRNSAGNYVTQQKRRVLEFVAVKRLDNGRWSIPGGFLFLGNDAVDAMKSAFIHKAVPDPSPELQENIDELFLNGDEIYRGYADDPRNTDNAWMETICYNFHDESGELVDKLLFRAGRRVDTVAWMKMTSTVALFAGHLEMLRLVAKKHNAAF